MNVRRFLYYAVLCAFLLLACSSKNGEEIQTREGKEGGDKTPISERASQSHDADYSIKIFPEEGFSNTAFKLTSTNFEISDAKIQWVASGVIIKNAEGASFTPKDARYGKGDTVQAKAIIDGRELLSNTVKLKNAPPEFTKIKLLPEVFKQGDTFYVDAAVNDADGDEVTVSYKWLKNREPAGEGPRIDSALKRGDRISVTVTPFDGEDYGRQVVLDKKIENLPPVIVEDNMFNFNGNVYTHQVRADDPDGDELTYSLKSVGENISVDAKTGLITWNVPKEFTGSVPVTVSVTDGHGGESTRQLTFTINPAPVKGK